MGPIFFWPFASPYTLTTTGCVSLIELCCFASLLSTHNSSWVCCLSYGDRLIVCYGAAVWLYAIQAEPSQACNTTTVPSIINSLMFIAVGQIHYKHMMYLTNNYRLHSLISCPLHIGTRRQPWYDHWATFYTLCSTTGNGSEWWKLRTC